MGQPFTDNNGTTFHNINQCRSFTFTAAASIAKLASQPCSEVVIINTSGSLLSAYDSGYSDPANALLIPDNTVFTIRGLTNSDQVSAAGSGPLSYRTQFFSNNPQR